MASNFLQNDEGQVKSDAFGLVGDLLMCKRCPELQGQLQDLRRDNAKLQKQLQEAQSDRDKFINELYSSNRSIQNYQELKDAHARLCVAFEGLKKEKELVMSDNKTLRETGIRFQSELEQAILIRDGLRRSINSGIDAEKEQLKVQLEHAQHHIACLNERLTEQELLKEQMQSYVEDFKNERQDREKIAKALDSSEALVSRLKGQIDRLEHELSKERVENKNLSMELRKLQSPENKKLQELIREYSETCNLEKRYANQARALERRINSLTSEQTIPPPPILPQHNWFYGGDVVRDGP